MTSALRNLHSIDQPVAVRPPRLRAVARWAAAQMAAGMQVVNGNRFAEGFGILMYHRVADRVPGDTQPTWNVTPQRLRRQLSGLLSRGFTSLPLAKLVDAQREARPVPSNVFAVTFDDGFENNFVNAFPILQELNIPATIFLATNYLDTDRPFPCDDWLAAGSNRAPCGAWRPLSTSQCRQMLDSGLIELGAHTHTHDHFFDRPDEFRRDLTACLDVLRDRFGIERPAFAFPFGEHTPEMIDVAKQLGVYCCLSTQEQRVRWGEDPFTWGRYHAGASSTSAELAAKLSGWHTTVATAGKRLAQPLDTIRQAVARPLNGSRF